MHYSPVQMVLIYVLWTLAAWLCVVAYLFFWEGVRSGGRLQNTAVKKEIVWFALKTALIVGVAALREYW